MIYAFDFDDTLFSHVNGEPIESVIDLVRERYERGDYIYIVTSRDKSFHSNMVQKLKAFGVPFHELLHDSKPKSHLMIDDSVVNVKNYIKNPEKWDQEFRKRGKEINHRLRNRGY